MKRLLLGIFLLTDLSVLAQPFGNEWVDYSQPYFEFSVFKPGIYSITYDTLAQSLASQGFAIGSIDPRNLQIFNRGEEQHIYVVGEADGSFDPGDRIELYATGSDGTLDDGLFVDPIENGNPYYSEINDTIQYYLTWNSSTNNARSVLETDTDYPAYTASPYILREEVVEHHEYLADPNIPEHYPGREYGEIRIPGYTAGEGNYGYYFDDGFDDIYWDLNTRHRYVNGPDAEIEIVLVGLTPDHKPIQIQLPGSDVDTAVDGMGVHKFNFVRPTNTLDNLLTNFRFIGPPNDGQPGTLQAVVSYVKVKYPQTANLTGIPHRKIVVPDNPNFPAQQKSRVVMPELGLSEPIIYDLTGHRRIPAGMAGTNYQFLIPDIGIEKHCFVGDGDPEFHSNVNLLKPAGRNNSPYFTDLQNLDPGTEFFAITHSRFFTQAEEYANYRTLTGQTALAIEIDELCAQFGNGVPKHPLGIRNFAKWAIATLNAPKNIFLIGKSVAIALTRDHPTIEAQNLVPSFGDPPCDQYYTAYLSDPTIEAPAISVGRLAAQTTAEVSGYLDKVMEYEATGPELWKKRGIHFSGGGNEAEANSLRLRLDEYKAFFEDTLIGGQVTTFQKTTSEPFQVTQVDSIENMFTEGIQLATFFGHGASVGFDISIDHPSTFNITDGKYPTMLGLSCFAGDIHQPAPGLSMSESWVLHPNGGALAFISNVHQGLVQYLHIYFRQWYQNLSQDDYGKTIGELMRHTIAENTQLSNPITTAHNLGISLHGDPSLVITSTPLPDLKTSVPEVFTEPTELTTLLDSFDVKVVVSNLGQAFTDSFMVEITRTLPNGNPDTLIALTHPPIFYSDTLTFTFAIDPINDGGLNSICVSLDNTFLIEEMSETNNDVCIEPLIVSPEIIPVYPYEFAVVPDQGVTLKASTGDPFAPSRTYRFEVDTTDLFNSPIKQNTTITQSGGVVEWSPKLLINMPDSTVYFWRASVDSATYGEYQWRESSFQYIVDKYGWGQAHFFQYKKDRFSQVEHDRPDREFEFDPVARNLTVNNFGFPNDLSQSFSVNYYLDNDLIEYSGCLNDQQIGNVGFTPQILVGVIDPCTLEPWLTPGWAYDGSYQEGQGDNGQLYPCRGRQEGWYHFSTWSAQSLDSMEHFINDIVPDSHYVFMLTWRNVDFVTFGPQWLQPFQNLGATGIDTILAEPYIFFCKKGDPSSAMEVAGSDSLDFISLSVDLVGCTGAGQVTSTLIGPTSEWGSLHFRLFPEEQPTQDTFAINVIGITQAGTQTTLMTGLNNWTTDIPDLASSIDADLFPYMKLNAYLKDDSTSNTAPQLDRWQVLFDGVPEAALSPNIHFAWSGDSLADGQPMMFATSIKNISEFDMDSLLVHYWIVDENNNRVDIAYPRQDSLKAGEELIDTVYFTPSAATQGLNTFWVEVNPVPTGQTSGYDQLEQYHFNNLGYLRFSAQGDNVNPIMDVTFDGVHILDGDIVSAKPLIAIEVDDESEFRLLTDTSDIQVYLSRPNSSQLERIWFKNGQTMQFYPGEAPDNKARIEFPADFPIDGVYELIVQSYDRSHNASGEQFYRISFEVINRSTITEIMNWPNPFSTNTKFVFTLTGSQVPTFFKIQIMTISGRVVKEIFMDDLGPINIGRNITQYGWDGKDTYGDQLANGIYLYRVITSIDGQSIEHRESGADQWIEHDLGKMMLIR